MFNVFVFSAQNLHSFLSHPNCLETLDLSNSDCSLELVKAAQTHTHIYSDTHKDWSENTTFSLLDVVAVNNSMFIFILTVVLSFCKRWSWVFVQFQSLLLKFSFVGFSGVCVSAQRIFEASVCPQHVKDRLLSQVTYSIHTNLWTYPILSQTTTYFRLLEV